MLSEYSDLYLITGRILHIRHVFILDNPSVNVFFDLIFVLLVPTLVLPASL